MTGPRSRILVAFVVLTAIAGCGPWHHGIAIAIDHRRCDTERRGDDVGARYAVTRHRRSGHDHE